MSILGIGDTNQSVVLQISSSDVGSGVAKTSIYEVAGLLILIPVLSLRNMSLHFL